MLLYVTQRVLFFKWHWRIKLIFVHIIIKEGQYSLIMQNVLNSYSMKMSQHSLKMQQLTQYKLFKY